MDITKAITDSGKKLFDKKLLKIIFTEYISTEGMNIEDLSKKYESDIDTDGDGDRYVTAILQDKVIVQFAENKDTKQIMLGGIVVVLDNGETTKGDDGFTGTYYTIPDLDELEAMSYN
jgi:hypothetical protein